jgi:hypothetical protein
VGNGGKGLRVGKGERVSAGKKRGSVSVVVRGKGWLCSENGTG